MILRYANQTRLNGEKKNKNLTVTCIERNATHFNNTPVDYNTKEVSVANRTSFDGHQQSKRERERNALRCAHVNKTKLPILIATT